MTDIMTAIVSIIIGLGLYALFIVAMLLLMCAVYFAAYLFVKMEDWLWDRRP